MSFRLQLVDVIGITTIIVLLSMIPFAIFVVGPWTCEQRWAASGMASRYTVGAGCKVQRKDGTWVPDSMVREVSQ